MSERDDDRPSGRLRWVLGGVGLVGLVLAGYLFFRPAAVATVSPETRDIQRTLAVVGRVRPPLRSELGAPVAGVVREVRVREGDRVAAGALLVRLDDREARAAVAEAEARLVEVEADAAAELAQAERELQQTERDLERLRAVFAEGGLTLQRVEQAEQRAVDAAARLQSARARMDPESPVAVVEAARAAVEAARARLALTAVRAPHDATVLQRLVEPGDAVEPGRGLVTVMAGGPLEIVAFPSEDNLARLRIGAAAVLSADAYADTSFHGTLSFVAPVVDPDQGTVEIRLSVTEPPAYLLPDMTVSVNVEAGRRTGATVLPANAVRGLGTEEPWIAVVEDGRVARRPVRVGLRGEAFVEILSELEADLPVIPASEDATVGDRVRVAAPPADG